MKHITINGRKIGGGEPCYIIAELSANHNGSYDEAVELVHLAKESGADAVKLQTYRADTITIDSQRPEFQIGKGTIWEGKNLYALYEEAFTPWEWQPKLKAEADKIGITLFSSPFDLTAVDFLEKMDVPAYKIASFELVDHGLIEKVAKTGKPLIMSTGMGSFDEIQEAVAVARQAGCKELVLLKCTSAYPALPEEMHLRTMQDLAEKFDVFAGLSDHTKGIAVPVVAVTMGACVIEKHFTKSRAVEGPDSVFSLEPTEFKQMVEAVRVAERAIGEVSYALTEKEEASKIFRRSLYVVEEVKEGEVFTEKNVKSIRPANGLAPKFLKSILGKKAAANIQKGTPLKSEDVESGIG